MVKAELRKTSKPEKENIFTSTRAIEHVIDHMVHLKKTDGCSIFELEHLYSFYTQCLTDLDENMNVSAMNKTRFKEKLL